MSLSDVLKKRRAELGYTLLEIADKMGVSEATVQRWESGNIKSLRHGRIAQLAEILDVSPASLMGWEVSSNDIPKGFMPLPKTVKRPRLGVISCGDPINSEEIFDGYDDVPEHINCDFTLKCEGDSMTGARITGHSLFIAKKSSIC